MLSKQTFVTPRGVTDGRIDVYNYGPGFSKVWFTGSSTRSTSRPPRRSTTTRTQVRFNFIVRKLDDEKLTSTVADAFVKEINKQFAGGQADLGAQGAPAGARARRHRRPDHEVPQVVPAVLRGTVRSDGLTRGSRRLAVSVVTVWWKPAMSDAIPKVNTFIGPLWRSPGRWPLRSWSGAAAAFVGTAAPRWSRVSWRRCLHHRLRRRR